jgi:hypothetical protein
MLNPDDELRDEELVRSLRAALPRTDGAAPSGDLWPLIIDRTRQTGRWSTLDWSAAAVIVIALLMFPKWFWFVAYHL